MNRQTIKAVARFYSVQTCGKRLLTVFVTSKDYAETDDQFLGRAQRVADKNGWLYTVEWRS